MIIFGSLDFQLRNLNRSKLELYSVWVPLVNTSIMIQSSRTSTPGDKQIWLADGSAGSGDILPLYNWDNHLSQEGQKYDYLVNGSKSWLIIKSDVPLIEAKKVFGDEVNITAEGQHHLEAVIGSQEFKDQYCWEKVLG